MTGKDRSTPGDPYLVDLRDFAMLAGRPEELTGLWDIVNAHIAHLKILSSLEVDKQIEPPLAFLHHQGGGHG